MTPEQMAEEIGVTSYNLKLFLLQNRIFPEQKERNLLLEMLTLKFTKPEYFTPTKDFYKAVGIGQRRFWQLYRGEKKITEKEYRNLTLHFKVSLQDAFEMRQLSLLDNGIFTGK
ncbi:XRE family transcriptional regulator [Paludibacter sp. 221]|nr:XRE family transcriptional regulator [Paludibacter sp. 221]